MGQIAFVFPGQGAQYAGMGRELSKCSPAAAEVFRLADRVRKTDMRFRPGVIDTLQTLVGEAEIDCAAILRQVDSLLEA